MSHTDDPHNLQRFIDAQASTYQQVYAELRQGSKRSHWMWFIFPQISGLGRSSTAVRYAITSKEEAVAYLAHPILGPRLIECVTLVNQLENRSLDQIFGYPDNLKFRSSMTLFATIATEKQIFLDALQKYCQGNLDPATLQRLKSMQSPGDDQDIAE